MNETLKRNIKKWSAKIALALYDVFAVVFSYYIALFIRFYVNHRFHTGSRPFFEAFFQFIPYYVVCCIIVFAIFKLYSSMWRYAGMSDMNRILMANAVTCVIHIAGTMLFVRTMPKTYYALGAIIQFLMIVVSRFGLRVLTVEIERLGRRKSSEAAVNVMIIGTGESAKSVLRLLANDPDNLAHPVCVVDYRNREGGRFFDGLPALFGVDGVDQAAGRYQVKGAIIADSLMPPETRAEIRERCKKLDVVVQDFSGYSQVVGAGIAMNKLMEYVDSPVDVIFEGKKQRFDNGEQAAMTLTGRYVVKAVGAEGGRLVVEIAANAAQLNTVDEAWAREYEKETGQEISFF